MALKIVLSLLALGVVAVLVALWLVLTNERRTDAGWSRDLPDVESDPEDAEMAEVIRVGRENTAANRVVPSPKPRPKKEAPDV